MAWVEAHVLMTEMKFHFLIYSHTIGKALPSAQASFKLCFFIWPLASSNQKMVNQKILQHSLVYHRPDMYTNFQQNCLGTNGLISVI
jgi:hypothetical protein